MEDSVERYRLIKAQLKAKMQALHAELIYMEERIEGKSTQVLTPEAMWKETENRLKRFLSVAYQFYSTGVPDLTDCKLQIEVTFDTQEFLHSSDPRPRYKWTLLGPYEELGGTHRQSFPLNYENSYLCERPDAIFASYVCSLPIAEVIYPQKI